MNDGHYKLVCKANIVPIVLLKTILEIFRRAKDTENNTGNILGCSALNVSRYGPLQ